MISQLKAIDLAIEAIEDVRRRKFAAGDAAYRQGIRKDVIKDKSVTGTGFAWAEDDHNSYVELTQAIRQLEDLKEILVDPGVTIDEFGDLPLFEAL
jgi:hypothetical protein